MSHWHIIPPDGDEPGKIELRAPEEELRAIAEHIVRAADGGSSVARDRLDQIHLVVLLDPEAPD